MRHDIFNAECRKLLEGHEELIASIGQPTYRFMDMRHFEQLILTDPRESNRVYWAEIIARAHMAATTAILRSTQWVDAVDLAAKNSNALAFAASLRGLMESAADTATSLHTVSRTLAANHAVVTHSLAKRGRSEFHVCEELENELIHFLVGRKLRKGEKAPESHQAKSVRAYLASLEKANIQGVSQTYSALCDLTHPGALSVQIWLTEETEGSSRIRLGQEDLVIQTLAKTHPDLLGNLLMFAFNPPVLVLAVLNYFDLPRFQSPYLKRWNLSGIKAWKKIRKTLGSAKPLC